MNRIDQLFNGKGENILSIYFTAGHPELNSTEEIILELDKSGADLIEIGMPYSDPMADGPTIQESGSIALKNGMTLTLLFDQLKGIRTKTNIPLLMMGYLNQMMQFGVDNFLENCVNIGIDGLIIPDLPVDIYEVEFMDKIVSHGLHTIFLITPQTTEERIRKIDKLGSGFVYMVSDASITGAKSGISNHQLKYFQRVNKMELKNPRLIGFGISNYDTFFHACKYASGAIIGSAFIKALGDNSMDINERISRFISSIRGQVEIN